MEHLNLNHHPGYILAAKFCDGVCTIVTPSAVYETFMSNTMWATWKASTHPQTYYTLSVEPRHTWKTLAVRRYD